MEEAFLLREARENIKKLERAERLYVERGDWKKATECANRRLAEITKMQLLMRYDNQEVM